MCPHAVLTLTVQRDFFCLGGVEGAGSQLLFQDAFLNNNAILLEYMYAIQYAHTHTHMRARAHTHTHTHTHAIQCTLSPVLLARQVSYSRPDAPGLGRYQHMLATSHFFPPKKPAPFLDAEHPG
jgi:hypothetical protein